MVSEWLWELVFDVQTISNRGLFVHEHGVNVHEQMSILANAEWGAVLFVFGFTLCYLYSNFTDQMTDS